MYWSSSQNCGQTPVTVYSLSWFSMWKTTCGQCHLSSTPRPGVSYSLSDGLHCWCVSDGDNGVVGERPCCLAPDSTVAVPSAHCRLLVQGFPDSRLSVPWSCCCPGPALAPGIPLLYSCSIKFYCFFMLVFGAQAYQNWIHKRHIPSLVAWKGRFLCHLTWWL